MSSASGFGGGQPALFGDRQQTHPLSSFEFLAIGMVLFPATLLAVIAARCAAVERDRRLALLQAMGAPPWARVAASLGEAVLPVLTGTVGAAVLAALAMMTDWQLPYVAFTVPAADLRRWAPGIFLSVAAAGVAILATVTVMNRPSRRNTASRPGRMRRFRARRVAWLCPLFAILATRASDVTTGPDGMVNQMAFTCLYTVGVVGALATLPAVIAVVAEIVGRRLAGFGVRRGYAAALVAGRWMQAHAGVIARMVASVVVALGLVVQVQLHSSRMDGPARAALATNARLGDSLLTIRTPDRRDGIADLADDLPHGVHLLAVDDTADGLRLTGDCAALKALHLGCTHADRGLSSDPRLDEFAEWSGHPPSQSVTWHRGQLVADGHAPRELLAVSEQGREIPVAALKRAAYRNLPSAQILAPGGEYLNTEPLRKAADWTVFMGIAGVGLLMFGSIVNNMGDFLRLGRALAPLSVLVGRRSIFYATAAWAIAGPLVVAACLGTLLAMLLGAPLTQRLGAVADPGGIAVLATVTLSVALAAWWWAAATAARAASRFSPAAD
ncbi:FtsX-like permease family protein [Streptomyces qinglanensis]|uniref:FtsX-like permease family protein n=1 Tax=Streptomyces qinglanensis TaxID=943816 RepID=UPI003D72C5E7